MALAAAVAIHMMASRPSPMPRFDGVYRGEGELIGWHLGADQKPHNVPRAHPAAFRECYDIRQTGRFLENKLLKSTLSRTGYVRPGFVSEKNGEWTATVADSHAFVSYIRYDPTRVENGVVEDFDLHFVRLGALPKTGHDNFPVAAYAKVVRDPNCVQKLL